MLLNIRKIQHYLILSCQNKISRDFYTDYRNFVTAQIRQPRSIFMNIDSMLHETIESRLGASSVT